jgi:branched-chain amino acid transport system substrate-binding protein
MRTTLATVSCVGLVLFVAFAALPVDAGQAPAEVKIGNLLPLSGGLANDGAQVRRGFDLALEEINAAGGIKALHGAKIRLIYGDTRGEPTVGMSEIEKLITQEKVSLIIGAHQSNVTLPGTAVAEKYKVPYYVPNATSDKITEQGYKYTFRSNVKANWGAKDEIKFLVDVGKQKNDPVKTLGIIYEDTEGGQTFAAGVRDEAKKAGLPITFDEAYPHGGADVTPVITKVKQAAPDAVLFNSYVQDAILLAKTVDEMRFNAKAMVGWGGYADPAFIKGAGKTANFWFNVGNWEKDMNLPAARALADKFQKKYGVPLSAHAATGYSALYVAKQALEDAASADPQKIRDAFAKIEVKAGPAMVMPFQKFTFDENGQNPFARYIVSQIVNGEYRTVWPNDITPPENKIAWPMPKWEVRSK